MKRLAALALLVAAALPAAAAAAPVRLLADSESAEALARILRPALERELGTALAVERRPGQAVASAARAAPDGRTLVLFDSGRGFEAAAGLTPVSMVARMPFVILAGPRAGFGSLEGLLEVARHNPGKLLYATSGTGSPQHLAAELFFGVAGVQLKHVAYKAAPHAIAATVSNDTQVLVEAAAPVEPYAHGRALNALAVTTTSRYPGLPAVRTVREAGVQGFGAGAWYALALPAGAPAATVERLRAALGATLAREEVRRAMAAGAFVASQSTPAELSAHLKAEIARWRAVRAEAGID